MGSPNISAISRGSTSLLRLLGEAPCPQRHAPDLDVSRSSR
jgi:hypothetical protein